MGFYVNCPYYKSSAAYGSSTIVCEDTPRDFKTFEKKNEWLEHVCQDDWKSCPYAQGLNGLYERTEKMNLTKKEREHLEYTCKQQKAELEEFAYANGIEYTVLNDILIEYMFNGGISDESIRKRLVEYKLGLLKLTKLTTDIKQFVTETYKKFKAEGE